VGRPVVAVPAQSSYISAPPHPGGPCLAARRRASMHYPHRTSRIKRKRAIGFRARMKTKYGRKMMNRKRRAGRSLNVADK